VSRIKLGAVPYVYPVPIVLVGATVEGRPNYATVGDCAIMGIDPALVAVSLSDEHHTTKGVLAHRTFSVNIPSTELLALADYFGTFSGRDVDKGKLVRSFYGELATAPMIDECPVNLECRVMKDFAIRHRHVFVADVVQAHVRKEYVSRSEGSWQIADLTRLDPILYALDNRYYKIGKPIGVGYREGAAHRTGHESPRLTGTENQ
jgi:flavin reductase (DIM6/NTAB) family NADH-FMN oxidoreductase RutF